MPDVTFAGWSVCSSCGQSFRRTEHYRGWFDTDRPYTGRRFGSLCAGCIRHVVRVMAPEWAAREAERTRREAEARAAQRQAFLDTLNEGAA